MFYSLWVQTIIESVTRHAVCFQFQYLLIWWYLTGNTKPIVESENRTDFVQFIIGRMKSQWQSFILLEQRAPCSENNVSEMAGDFKTSQHQLYLGFVS